MRIIEEQVDLAGQCLFHVGGKADFFARVSSLDELAEALAYAGKYSLPVFIFSGGSNIFFDDTGYRGLAIRMVDGSFEIDEAGGTVKADAGYSLGKLVRELARRDTGGLSFLANIPGSVGGAVVGNAGCYGRCVADVLTGAEVLDLDRNELFAVGPDYFRFDYRHSRLKDEDNLVVVTATFRVEHVPGDQVLAELEQELTDRMSKHPHNAWCAGSFFKNESRERPAWKLITEAGMASARVGDAAISDKHANFLVNEGHATSTDIIELAIRVRDAVREKHGVELVPEVRYVSPDGIRPF